MPLYDYRCDRCGAFRALRSIRESGVPALCPQCGAACGRQLSAPFLASGADGWLTRPRGGQGRGGWRSACGLGCLHANCR